MFQFELECVFNMRSDYYVRSKGEQIVFNVDGVIGGNFVDFFYLR